MSLMISSYRKTRKGSVVKIVRERYLRDDIHCGRSSCENCKRFKLDSGDQFVPPAYLDDQPRAGINSQYSKPHYVVLDYSLIGNQVDVICDSNFGNDIVIMQTSWKEIKPNISVYSKLKELMSSRRIYIFDNEYNRETFRFDLVLSL